MPVVTVWAWNNELPPTVPKVSMLHLQVIRPVLSKYTSPALDPVVWSAFGPVTPLLSVGPRPLTQCTFCLIAAVFCHEQSRDSKSHEPAVPHGWSLYTKSSIDISLAGLPLLTAWNTTWRIKIFDWFICNFSVALLFDKKIFIAFLKLCWVKL